MQTNLDRPCRQCPFLRASMPGWLGPWLAEELLATLGSTSFPCHQTIREDGQDTSDPALESCAGSALFLNHTQAISRCGWSAAHQDALRAADEKMRDSVFRTNEEFLDHHRDSPLAAVGRRAAGFARRMQSTR